MAHDIPLDPSSRADDPHQDKHRDDHTHEVAPDLAYRRLGLVNVVFIGKAGASSGHWVLIDTGVMGTTGLITSAVEERFGRDSRPACIVMTHAHFDHVGGLPDLADRWDVPVYAHELERPFLDGSASYPPPDPGVGGGLMARLSPLYPRGPVDVGGRLRTLPPDSSIPDMPGWRWIDTPGHTPGHVSLWRETDRTIVAGDAFITTDQESAYAVTVQKPMMQGPPMYFTQNWVQARESVERLAALEPEVAMTMHGRPMRGSAMRAALHRLAREFDRIAVPEHGKYVQNPTWTDDGSAYRPA